jgi:hypothetical protein
VVGARFDKGGNPKYMEKDQAAYLVFNYQNCIYLRSVFLVIPQHPIGILTLPG